MPLKSHRKDAKEMLVIMEKTVKGKDEEVSLLPFFSPAYSLSFCL